MSATIFTPRRIASRKRRPKRDGVMKVNHISAIEFVNNFCFIVVYYVILALHSELFNISINGLNIRACIYIHPLNGDLNF